MVHGYQIYNYRTTFNFFKMRIIKNNLVIKGRKAFFVPNIIENGEKDSQKQVKLFSVMK